GYFGNIDRCCYRGCPYADSPNKPKKGKTVGFRSECRTYGRDEIQHPDPEQGLFAPQSVGGNAPKKGSQHSAPEGHGHDEDAVEGENGVTQEPIGIPQFLDGLVGP